MNNQLQTLFRQVRLLNPVNNTDRIADVLIKDLDIKAIETHLTDLPKEINMIDCQGLVLGTGLVDLYSRSGQPGYEQRETIASLAAAGAAGGFTRLAILPDTFPPIDNSAVLASLLRDRRQSPYLENKNSQTQLPQLDFWGALTIGIQGQKMSEIAELAAEGVIGFTDGYPIDNLGLLRQLLEYLKPFNKPVALFTVNQDLKGNGVMREGKTSIGSGLPGNPRVSEAAAIAAVLELVDEIGTPIHFMRISTARGVELVASAKAKGLPITASTTWMHLLLSSDRIIDSYDSNLHLEAPLGDQTDVRALIQGIKQGTVDAIAVDHTPHTYEEKTVAFAEAPPGVIGLELALSLLWQGLVVSKELTALELWRALSVGPQLCLYQTPKEPSCGQNAELALFEPKLKWKVDKNNLTSLSANTPWFSKEMTGRVVRIWNS